MDGAVAGDAWWQLLLWGTSEEGTANLLQMLCRMPLMQSWAWCCVCAA